VRGAVVAVVVPDAEVVASDPESPPPEQAVSAAPASTTAAAMRGILPVLMVVNMSGSSCFSFKEGVALKHSLHLLLKY
jgi:hypothetical protein